MALVLLLVGWGGNQFTPLMLMYQADAGLSAVTVNAVLGVYVLGLVPALLAGGPASDRLGRRRVTTGAVLASLAGSAVMTLGPLGAWVLFPGRFVTGVAAGLAMAAATSWVKELSDATPGARRGAGARRASVALTSGFGFGPVLTVAVALWAPAPQVLPYVVHLLLTVPLLHALRAVPETAPFAGRRTSRRRGRRQVPPGLRSTRFRRVVAPAALWMFGVNAISIAVLPLVVADTVRADLLYATVLIALNFGAGIAVQPLARRLDDLGSARALLVAMTVVGAGLGLAAATAATGDPRLGAVAAVVLGSSYGINLVSGLQEVQRLAGPDELGALTGAYYVLGYVGFLLPTVMAVVATWASYPAMLVTLAVLATVGLLMVRAASRTGLPDRTAAPEVPQ